MDNLYSFVCIVLITVRLAHSLECYSCLNNDDANNCNKTTICQNGQDRMAACISSCFMDVQHTEASPTVNLGCKDNQLCGQQASNEIGLVGRDMTERQANGCDECCSSDFCNRDLCVHSKPSACTDDPKTDCAYLNSLVSICQDIHHAKTICAKFCGLCALVDGNWAEWSQWTTCDVTCDNGIQYRTRTCTNPAPANGGLNCTGKSFEVKSCKMPLCPVHGGWSTWGQWATCSVTCDTGIQQRHRNCSNPYPDRFGDHCFGDGMDVRICSQIPCAPGGIPTVIFYGKDVYSLTNPTGAKLTFSTTLSNEGNGYNHNTGVFTAPVSGTYLMSAHICADVDNAFGLAFVLDYHEVHKDFVSSISSSVHCQTSDITLHLKQGSTVYIKCTYGGTLVQNSYYWNSFSGSLLHL